MVKLNQEVEMMKRKKYPKGFKARVMLEALKGEKSIAQINSDYEVHSNMITKWKKQLKKNTRTSGVIQVWSSLNFQRFCPSS